MKTRLSDMIDDKTNDKEVISYRPSCDFQQYTKPKLHGKL